MKVTYNIVSDYKLHDSVLFNLGTTLYVFNDLARFVSEIKPSIDCVYIGLYIEEIVGFRTAVIILNMLKSKK